VVPSNESIENSSHYYTIDKYPADGSFRVIDGENAATSHSHARKLKMTAKFRNL
jgi:hypothetical protein